MSFVATLELFIAVIAAAVKDATESLQSNSFKLILDINETQSVLSPKKTAL